MAFKTATTEIKYPSKIDKDTGLATSNNSSVAAPSVSAAPIFTPIAANALKKDTYVTLQPKSWRTGENPTTPEYYAAFQRINENPELSETDREKANAALKDFKALQNAPQSNYYSPYLRMTNVNVAQGIYDLTGKDYSGGITQKDIDELKPYADYSNVGINNTPNKSGTDAQMLAYWLYQAEKDEATTQAVEAEMQHMNTIVKRLVDDGYSDDYIREHLDVEDYPNIAKMIADAKLNAPTPLNRAVNYSDEWLDGALWAAHNGGTSGNNITDIASYHNGKGNKYKPNAESEAARDPSSDNYHPYSHGATLDWLYTDSYPESGVYDQAWFDANVGMKAESEEKNKEYNKAYDAYQRTERAKAELEKLKGTAQNLLDKGKTADEVYAHFFGEDGSMRNMETDYPTLVDMEEERRSGNYVSLTDTVDFAAPYFKEWLFANSNEGREAKTKGIEQGAETAAVGATAIASPDGKAKNVTENVTVESAETGIEGENLTAEEKYPMPPMNEVAAEPTANFDVTQVAEGTPEYADIVDDLKMYRRGAAPSNPDAAAFIQQFPYLFAGEVTVGNSSGASWAEDQREKVTQKYGPVEYTPINGTSYYDLLVKMDEAQKNGIITQSEYTRFLFGMGNEIAKSGDNLKSDLQNENSEAYQFGKTYEKELGFATATHNAEIKQKKIESAQVQSAAIALIDNGMLTRDMTEEQALQLGVSKDFVDSAFHAYDEINTRKFTADELAKNDPEGYSTALAMFGNTSAKELLENSTYSERIQELSADNLQLAESSMSYALGFIDARVENALLMDQRKAAVFGLALDEYYNSIGIDKRGLKDYKDSLYADAFEEFEAYNTMLDDDFSEIADAFRRMTEYEGAIADSGFGTKEERLENAATEEERNAIEKSYSKDWVFTDNEIDDAVLDGELTEDEAEKLKLYQRALNWSYKNSITGNAEANKENLRKAFENEEDEYAYQLMHDKMMGYLSTTAKRQNEQLMSGSTPDEYVKAQMVGTGEGAKLDYVVVSSAKLGFKQHTLSWAETYYAVARRDSAQTERNFRTNYSREDVRKNIEAGILSLEDEDLKNALLEEYYNFDGDIYDFNFDFTNADIQNMLTRKREDIDFLQNEMKSIMTNEQFQRALNAASATNSLLFSGEAWAIGFMLTAVGAPAAAASILPVALTTGITAGAETINTAMDENPDADKSKLLLPAGGNMLVSTMVESAFDINIGAAKLPFNRAALKHTMSATLEANASENLLKTLAYKGGSVLAETARVAYENAAIAATNMVFETGGEVAQEYATRASVNLGHAMNGRWDLVEELTWDEVGTLIGDSFESGLIQYAVGETLGSAKNAISKTGQKRAENQAIVKTLIKQESLTGKEAKEFVEACKALSNDELALMYVEKGAEKAEVDARTLRNVSANKDVILNMPEYQEKNTKILPKLAEQRGKLLEMQDGIETAKQNVDAALEQFESEEVPSADTIAALTDSQEILNDKQEKFEQLQQEYYETDKRLGELNIVIDNAKKQLYKQATIDAKQEVAQEIATAKQAELEAVRQEEIARREALVAKSRDSIVKNLQANYGFTDKQLEKLDAKAKERIETQAQKEATAKDELLRLFQQKLPAYKVMYKIDTGDAAGWVVRQGGEGTLVLNPNIDYDTLTGALSAHELVHVAEDSAVYNDLVDVVKELYFSGDENKFNSAKTALNKDLTENDGRTLSDAEAGKEVIAEAIQDMFSGRGEWVKQIVAEKPNLAQRMFEWVKNKVDEFKLRRHETKEGKSEEEVNEAVKTYRQYVKIRRLLRDALSEAGKKITMDTVQDAVRKAGDTVMNRTRDLLHPEPNVQEETAAVAETETAETPIAKGETVPKAVVKADSGVTDETRQAWEDFKAEFGPGEEAFYEVFKDKDGKALVKSEESLYDALGNITPKEILAHIRSIGYKSKLPNDPNITTQARDSVDVVQFVEETLANNENGTTVAEQIQANADELVEYEAQFDYDDYNTEEENAIIEEANKDAEEYMSVTENEELTNKAETAAEEEAVVPDTEEDVLKSGGDIELADYVERDEYDLRDEDGLMNPKTFADDWSVYAVEKLGWTAAKDKINGYAQEIGFTGEAEMLETSLLIPIEWFAERGLGTEGYTADTHRAAVEEYKATYPEVYQRMFDILDGKVTQNFNIEPQEMTTVSDSKDTVTDDEIAMEATTEETEIADEENDGWGMSQPMKGMIADAFEFASKRRIEAAEKARKAARLLKDSAYFRETGDWTNYQKSLMQRMGLGEINKKLNTPDAILKGLASELGIGVYTGTIANGKHFAAYDARASALISDNKAAASDYATFMYSIGEKLKKIAGITDPSEDYALGDFMFDYMLQKDADFSAATRAYAKEFREKLKAAGSDFAQAIENARDKLQTFKNASAVERVNAFLVSRADKKKEGIGAQLRKFSIAMIDQTLAAEIVDETTGSHALREAAAYLPYARRRVERNIEGDTFVDVDGNRTGGYTLKTALADIKENELEAFEEYLFAREAVDRYEMGKAPFVVGDPASITLSQAKEAVATLVKQHPNFETAGQKYNEFWDNFMQTYVVGEGFLSQEEYEAMRKAHPNYVPFTREHAKNPSGRYASGANDIKFYRAVGNSNRKVYYPLENAIAKINQFTNRAMQNRFARVFDELYQANDDLGFVAEQLPLTVESMMRVGADGKTDPDKLMEELAGAFADKDKTEVAANSNNGTKLTVVRQDGTRVTYDIQDKPLFDLLSGSSVYNQIQGLEVGEKVRKAVAFVTSTMAKLTTGSNPLFMVRNFARDFQKSVNYGSWASNYLTGLLKMIKGLPEYAFKLTEKAKDFDALGGGEWERLNVNTTKGVKQFKKSLFADDFKRMSAAEKAKRIVLSPLRVPIKVIDWFGTNTEAGMRYMEYAYGKHNLSTAKGRQDAFMAAMESTVDFQRSGNQSRWLKAIVPFANATIQGNYQNVRMFTDAEKSRLGARLTKMILNNALMGAIETVINVHWGRSEEDREKYLNMPLETKQKYFMLPLDDAAEREFAIIPISQDWLSRICFEFGRKAALGEYEEEDGFAKDIATLAFGLVTEMVTETTTIASPFFDVLQNENYYGSPIVKQSLEDYLPEARYDTTTADAFKAASNVLARGARRLGISADSKLSRLVTPLALEYLAEQYTGVFGQLIIPSISFNKYTGEMGGWKVFGNVVRNRFTLDADSYNVITDRFYDICDTVTQMQKHIDSGRAYTLNPDLTEEEVSILFDEVADSDNKGGAIYEAKAISEESGKEIGRIMLRDDLTDHEKNVLIEEQYEIRNAAFMNVIAWFDPIQMQLDGNAPRLVSKRDPVEKRISNLPEAFKVDYENGEEYMLEAERLARLPGNSSKTTILPKPNLNPSRTINGTSYEYDLENDKRFKHLAEEYKRIFYGDEFDGYGTYAKEIMNDYAYQYDYDDEEKTQAFTKANTKANTAAKEWLWEQIDMMEEDKENEIEKYEGMTKGKVK